MGGVAAPEAGGRRTGRRWAWRSVGLLLTFLLVLYLGGSAAGGRTRARDGCCPGWSRPWLLVAVLLEAAAIASYTG